MKKCKNCFYSKACMSFEELNVTGNETPCDNFLDEEMVVVLPCPIGATVYQIEKDCENCDEYFESSFDSFVTCHEDQSMWNYDHDEVSSCDECKKHIKVVKTQFNINMVNRFGKDVFLTENVAFVDVAPELTHLAGHQYGKTVFNNIKSIIDYDKPVTFVFPERITHIATSFIQGFFEEVMSHWCMWDLETKMIVVSSIPNLKQIFIDDLK